MTTSDMVPAGYMAKRVVARPDWLPERISSIYSVSGCISKNFTDQYFTLWKHNGYWLFDSPEVIIEIAREKEIDLAETVLFFYEIHQLEGRSITQSQDRTGYSPYTRLRGLPRDAA